MVLTCFLKGCVNCTVSDTFFTSCTKKNHTYSKHSIHNCQPISKKIAKQNHENFFLQKILLQDFFIACREISVQYIKVRISVCLLLNKLHNAKTAKQKQK